MLLMMFSPRCSAARVDYSYPPPELTPDQSVGRIRAPDVHPRA
jgi:hypothetical protein